MEKCKYVDYYNCLDFFKKNNKNEKLKLTKNNANFIEAVLKIDSGYKDAGNPNKYPSIYEYYRNNNKEFWENGKYIYSQIKNEQPVIPKKRLNGQVKEIKWNPIDGVDKKYQYYILDFKRSN